MSLFQTLRISLLALARNKMRSFLTVLGVIIGVGAVIAMVAIGEGAKARVEEAFNAMGSNLLIVMPGSTTAGGVRGGYGSLPTLTWDDLHAIREEVPSVRYASPQLRSTSQLVSEDANWGTALYGVSPEYFDLRNWPIDYGARFEQPDVDAGAKVVVLGQTVVEHLFGAGADPVGYSIRINNVPFEIIGVAARKGQSTFGQDYDDAAFIPVTTFQSKIQRGLQKYLSGTIYVGAASASETARAQLEITTLLRERHNLRPDQPDDFSIRNLEELANARQEGTKTLTTLLASIAAVSLLVGGIGIMNIMLVSVTERTREIGLRMAIGAKRRHILAQFLAEALVLSLLGGIIGIALGLIAAHQLASRFDWPTLIRPDIIAISVAFSAVVGIVFGLYPARKASRLDPIEALRFE